MSGGILILEEKSSNTGREATKLGAECYHQWGNKRGKLVCLVCDKDGNNGIVNSDQICPGPLMGNLFETVVSEATLQQSEELHLAPQEA